MVSGLRRLFKSLGAKSKAVFPVYSMNILVKQRRWRKKYQTELRMV
jgi:hypothetical protein